MVRTLSNYQLYNVGFSVLGKVGFNGSIWVLDVTKKLSGLLLVYTEDNVLGPTGI